jgi:hypothetical protein
MREHDSKLETKINSHEISSMFESKYFDSSSGIAIKVWHRSRAIGNKNVTLSILSNQTAVKICH